MLWEEALSVIRNQIEEPGEMTDDHEPSLDLAVHAMTSSFCPVYSISLESPAEAVRGGSYHIYPQSDGRLKGTWYVSVNEKRDDLSLSLDE